MWRSLLTDLESVLRRARSRGPDPRARVRPPSRGGTPRVLEWLPYRAWIADRQVFVNLDALGFCLEVRPQSGADEEMARADRALRGTSPPARASSSTCTRVLRSAHRWRATRTCASPTTSSGARHLGRAGRHTNIHRTMARRRAGTTCGQPTSLLSAQSYLFRTTGWSVSVSFPAVRENLARLDELLLLRDGIRPRCTPPVSVPSVDGGGSDQFGLRAARPTPANRRRYPLTTTTWDASCATGDRPRTRACASTARASAWPTRPPTCKPNFA